MKNHHCEPHVASSRRAGPIELLRRFHRDERGGVSIETILIIAAIALPILIFIIKFGWPRIRDFFDRGMQELEEGSDAATGGS